jgi:hypothetical protein
MISGQLEAANVLPGLIAQAATADDKIRLDAAINLGKHAAAAPGDKKVIAPLVHLLFVRGPTKDTTTDLTWSAVMVSAAALSIPGLLDDTVDPCLMNQSIAGLVGVVADAAEVTPTPPTIDARQMEAYAQQLKWNNTAKAVRSAAEEALKKLGCLQLDADAGADAGKYSCMLTTPTFLPIASKCALAADGTYYVPDVKPMPGSPGDVGPYVDPYASSSKWTDTESVLAAVAALSVAAVGALALFWRRRPSAPSSTISHPRPLR